MAKGQQQGLNALTVWMILFVALWLTSTVFLVILYTGQEELHAENQRLLSANRKLISGPEEKSIELVKSAQENGPTVAGLLEEARAKTAELATGDEGDSAAEVRQKRDRLLQTIQTGGLAAKADSFVDLSFHDALTRVYEGLKSERELRQKAEDRAAQLEAQINGQVEASTQQKNYFEKQAKETAQQLRQGESDHAAYRSERDKGVETIEREFADSRKRNDADLTKERQARAAAEKRVAELQKRLTAQQERLGELRIGPEKLATARQPDGKILSAVPGDQVVYVDLGRHHGLVLGLQFAVYSAQTGIPEDGRGKAQVEVVSIGQTSSECRIVGVVGNNVILQGDLVANPVYDPNRPLTFVVLGEFDLDRDGQTDRDGAPTLKSLIAEWGGKVSDELTPLTDFVVLGASPRRPKPPAEGAATGGSAASAAAQASDPVFQTWKQYQDLSEEARTLAVPILTQDVFLNFLGYRGGRVAAQR